MKKKAINKKSFIIGIVFCLILIGSCGAYIYATEYKEISKGVYQEIEVKQTIDKNVLQKQINILQNDLDITKSTHNYEDNCIADCQMRCRMDKDIMVSDMQFRIDEQKNVLNQLK
jgi:hypothetical protein